MCVEVSRAFAALHVLCSFPLWLSPTDRYSLLPEHCCFRGPQDHYGELPWSIRGRISDFTSFGKATYIHRMNDALWREHGGSQNQAAGSAIPRPIEPTSSNVRARSHRTWSTKRSRRPWAKGPRPSLPSTVTPAWRTLTIRVPWWPGRPHPAPPLRRRGFSAAGVAAVAASTQAFRSRARRKW